MMQTGPREGEVRAANEIFTLLPEGHDLAVIIDALAGRNGLSDKARSELSSRIRKLRIKGFRDANRAPHDRLVETILDTIAGGDHGLAAAILGTWMQTHSALRERATAHLRGRGIDVVDAPPVRFTSCWDEWLLERNRMLQDSDGAYAHRDDAALMLSLVSTGARMARRRGQPGQVDPLCADQWNGIENECTLQAPPDARVPERRRLCAPRRCRADAELGVRPVSRPPAGRIRALQGLDRHAVGATRVSARMARRRGQPGQVDPLHPAREGTRTTRSSKVSSTRSPTSGTGSRTSSTTTCTTWGSARSRCRPRPADRSF